MTNTFSVIRGPALSSVGIPFRRFFIRVIREIRGSLFLFPSSVVLLCHPWVFPSALPFFFRRSSIRGPASPSGQGLGTSRQALSSFFSVPSCSVMFPPFSIFLSLPQVRRLASDLHLDMATRLRAADQGARDKGETNANRARPTWHKASFSGPYQWVCVGEMP